MARDGEAPRGESEAFVGNKPKKVLILTRCRTRRLRSHAARVQSTRAGVMADLGPPAAARSQRSRAETVPATARMTAIKDDASRS